MSMEVANTIRKQIMGLSYWALGSWGAREYVGYPEGKYGKDGAYILGGLRFRVRTPRYPIGTIVMIYLMPDDTYTVRVCRVIGTKVTELYLSENVYFDMLVNVIDRAIENKETAKAYVR